MHDAMSFIMATASCPLHPKGEDLSYRGEVGEAARMLNVLQKLSWHTNGGESELQVDKTVKRK